ncbi:DUF6398 domain-containing protein [Candidatus Tisiphia endosymbiont of Nedyus quadrimaculatus]|uniref:DUF6398 domain-containing protein n=1 Tax=Candidatus Tisiphia endosymbiont of Nedyus quadrimaculatus TaxID=3139332 RepID=UPI00345EB300
MKCAIQISSTYVIAQSTISAKSKSIRDMLKISQLDSCWTLPSRLINKLIGRF